MTDTVAIKTLKGIPYFNIYVVSSSTSSFLGHRDEIANGLAGLVLAVIKYFYLQDYMTEVQ